MFFACCQNNGGETSATDSQFSVGIQNLVEARTRCSIKKLTHCPDLDLWSRGWISGPFSKNFGLDPECSFQQ